MCPRRSRKSRCAWAIRRRIRRGWPRTARCCCPRAPFSAVFALPALAEAYGRRATLALFYVVMMVSIAVGFGYVFYLAGRMRSRGSCSVCFFSVSAGRISRSTRCGCPNSISTDCRASAFAFATSVGRFAGAGITFLVGTGVAYFQTIGTPVALTAIAFFLGLFLVPFGVETRGQKLPA